MASDSSTSDPVLSPFAELLLDEAKSEFKRVGGKDLSLAHLALALRRRDPRLGEWLGAENYIASLVDNDDLLGVSTVLEFLASNHVDSKDQLAVLSSELAAILSTSAALNGATPTEFGERHAIAPVKVPPKPAQHPLGGFVEPRAILGRDDLVDEIIERLGRIKHPVTPLLLGARGSGRTSILGALAARIQQEGYAGPLVGTPIFRASAHALVDNDPIRSIRKLAAEVGHSSILCIDDFEVVAGLTRLGSDVGFLRTVRSLVAEQSPRTLLIMDSCYFPRLAATESGLDDDVEEVLVPQLSKANLDRVIATSSEELEAAHGVIVPESVRAMALSTAGKQIDLAQPGRAISRLDRACVRARMADKMEVTETDLDDNGGAVGPLAADGLAAALMERIKGQDEAVLRIAKRLALTRSGLDLRPSRPDGVFLLVGPTGVGKTELARTLAEQLMGDADLCIRLDMSEYALEWSMSRIVGPPPGYSGSGDPGSWLTTRVLAHPEAVILLDEFEKSHVQVWNMFLQVFDDGRLTDSIGRTVDFSNTIFFLTSNLGADFAAREPIGFSKSTSSHDAADQRLLGAIHSEIPPELLNRLDDVIIFHELSRQSIAEICQQLVDRIIARYRQQGFELQIDEPVIEFLATSGYNAEYGARHLQRNIEKLLLEPLVGIEGHALHSYLEGDSICWGTI